MRFSPNIIHGICCFLLGETLKVILEFVNNCRHPGWYISIFQPSKRRQYTVVSLMYSHSISITPSTLDVLCKSILEVFISAAVRRLVSPNWMCLVISSTTLMSLRWFLQRITPGHVNIIYLYSYCICTKYVFQIDVHQGKL